MQKMEINIPDEIAEYIPELSYFVQTMVNKLYTNRHKGFDVPMHLSNLLESIEEETKEARQALNDGQFEFMVECADISNQAWLASLKALRMTRYEWNTTADECRLLQESAPTKLRAEVVYSPDIKAPKRGRAQLPSGDADRVGLSGDGD